MFSPCLEVIDLAGGSHISSHLGGTGCHLPS